MNNYIYGFCFGLLLVVIIITINYLKNKNKTVEPVYDERQLQARNYAYALGFYTLITCIAIKLILHLILGEWCENAFDDITCILISVAVFVNVAILKDAYYSLKDSGKQQIVMMAIVIIIQMINVISVASNEGFIADGKITLGFLSVIVIIIFVEVLLISVIHSLNSKKNDLEDE